MTASIQDYPETRPLTSKRPLSSSLSVFSLLFSCSGLCDSIIQDIICTYLVLPNRISIPLVGESQLAQLRFPIPKVTLDTLSIDLDMSQPVVSDISFQILVILKLLCCSEHPEGPLYRSPRPGG